VLRVTAEIVISMLENKGLPHEPALLASLNERALAYLRQHERAGSLSRPAQAGMLVGNLLNKKPRR
jgi:hypothetical protein